MTSSNGINWTVVSIPVDNNWNSITYGNGIFVAVASSGNGNNIMTSSDGINWTLRNAANSLYGWSSVCYGVSKKFVAVSSERDGK